MELTGDDGIFPHLHKYFVFLLKAGGLRITECVLEGPPRVKLITKCVNVTLEHKPHSYWASLCVPYLVCLTLQGPIIWTTLWTTLWTAMAHTMDYIMDCNDKDYIMDCNIWSIIFSHRIYRVFIYPELYIPIT